MRETSVSFNLMWTLHGIFRRPEIVLRSKWPEPLRIWTRVVVFVAVALMVVYDKTQYWHPNVILCHTFTAIYSNRVHFRPRCQIQQHSERRHVPRPTSIWKTTGSSVYQSQHVHSLLKIHVVVLKTWVSLQNLSRGFLLGGLKNSTSIQRRWKCR